jgi:hypothetical protein
VKSWRDEDLILHFYGEHPRAGELERDLAARPELRERFEALGDDLATFGESEVPEPRPGLEERVWARLRPRLEERRPRPAWRGWRFAAVAAMLVAAVLGAYLAGRRSVAPTPEHRSASAERPLSAAARARILRASVADHLESSSLLLTDLSHASAGQSLGDERAWAASLLAENRLYRRAADRAGQRRIVALLDELEPLLVELANGTAGDEVPSLQRRIDQRDLLFKVRVVGSRLQAPNL